MHTAAALSFSTLFGFLLVLVRVSGIFTFVPLPGGKYGPDLPRIALSLGVTMSLYSHWPKIDGLEQSIGRLAGFLLLEAGMGLAIGLGVAFLSESFLIAAQIAGLQAGFGYASTVDPSTQADSTVLMVFAQLFAGTLFFVTGLDRDVIRIFADSLQSFPPGHTFLGPGFAAVMVKTGGLMLSTGVRLALPAVALLLLVDIALALLGRINAQLQLITLAFPIKILTSLLLLGWTAVLFPRVYIGLAGQVFGVFRAVTGGR